MTLLPEVLILCLLSLVGLPLLLAVWLGGKRVRSLLAWISAWILIIALLVTIAGLMSTIAVGFPENVRHGYPSCAACHVSPAGGGATTAYGRSAGAAAMNTWASDGEENPGMSLELPEWVAVGGDSRYINANVWSEDYSSHRKFWMQYDLELSLTPIRAITVSASAGRYGPDQELEFRRNYLKLQIGEHLSLRAGRFMPAYGIGFADHRLPTRAGLGLGEGQETYNVEGAAVGSMGEIFVTGVFGDETAVGLGDGDGYAVASDTRSGVVGSGALFLGDRAKLGLNYMGLSAVDHYRQAYGIFTIWGLTESVYLLAEHDRRFEDGTSVDLAAGRLGWEFVKGLHASVLGEASGPAKTAGLQLQWLPRPHWELLAEIKRTVTEQKYVDSGVLMFHHYL